MPNGVEFGRVLRDGNRLFILGGYTTADGSVNTILEFDTHDEEWIVREETLSAEKHFFYMIDVDNSMFC